MLVSVSNFSFLFIHFILAYYLGSFNHLHTFYSSTLYINRLRCFFTFHLFFVCSGLWKSILIKNKKEKSYNTRRLLNTFQYLQYIVTKLHFFIWWKEIYLNKQLRKHITRLKTNFQKLPLWHSHVFKFFLTAMYMILYVFINVLFNVSVFYTSY